MAGPILKLLTKPVQSMKETAAIIATGVSRRVYFKGRLRVLRTLTAYLLLK